MLVLEIVLIATLALWVGLAIFWVWSTRGATLLRPGRAGEALPSEPRVSILVPARNEEEALPGALESLLELDYPNYEVIVVDDASTDATGRVVDRWAASPAGRARLRVIHNRELPAGWTGKVHALSLAARAATGDWILATDADVIFHPASLRRALELAFAKNAQLVSVTPEFELGSFWEKVVLPAFSLLLSTLYPLRLVNRPDCPRAIAAGAFMLMRRGDFEALGGYEPLKRVVIEDVRMAERFKRHGRRIYLAASRGLLRTRMYHGVGELWEGLSRSAFEGTGFSVAKVFAGVTVGVTIAVVPWVVSAILAIRDASLGRPPEAALKLALAVCLVSALVYAPMVIFLRAPIIYVLTLPLAAVFYLGVALNSMFRSIWGAGVPWKERRYRPPD